MLQWLKQINWASINSYDWGSFLCEEACRCCGSSVPVDFMRHPGAWRGEPAGRCLCSDCTRLLRLSRQSLWWLPLPSFEEQEDSTGGSFSTSISGCRTENSRISSSSVRSATAGGSKAASSNYTAIGSAAGGDIRLFPVAAGGMYEGPLQKVIRRLKYDNDRSVVADIAPLLLLADNILRSALPDLPNNQDLLVVPVPLHESRQRKRGYNQAALLAEEYARSVGMKIEKNSLNRTKNTRPQYGLTKLERMDNVNGAFILDSHKHIKDRIIILVDDVFTSGATLRECAALLTAGGARYVAAIAAARAPLNMRS